METNSKLNSSSSHQNCEKHNLSNEFVCSCNKAICSQCIDTHKNHENFSLRKRKEIKDLFLTDLKNLCNHIKYLDRRNDLINLQDKLRNLNWELIQANVQPSIKEQKEIDHIKIQFNEFGDVSCLNEEQMNCVINSNFSHLLQMAAIKKYKKLNILRNNFIKNQEKFFKEYVKLFDKYISLNTSDKDKILENENIIDDKIFIESVRKKNKIENENQSTRKEFNKNGQMFTYDDIQYSPLIKNKFIEINENNHDSSKCEIPDFIEEESNIFNAEKITQSFSIKNELNFPGKDSNTKINLRTNLNCESKMNSNSKKVKEINTTLSLTESNIQVINPPSNTKFKMKNDKNLFQSEEISHYEIKSHHSNNNFNRMVNVTNNRQKTSNSSNKIINYAGSSDQNDNITKVCIDCGVNYTVNKDQHWRIRCIPCYKIFNKGKGIY
jgi:hypothetical protein